MKRILFSLLLLLTCQLAFCQSASSVFNDFRGKKHAEFTTVPRLLMSLASAKVKDGNVSALLKEVDEVKVLDLGECSNGVRKKFFKKMTALEGNGYSNINLFTNGKGGGKTVLVKEKGSKIEELVVLDSGEDSCVGVLVTGSINTEDIAAILGVVSD